MDIIWINKMVKKWIRSLGIVTIISILFSTLGISSGSAHAQEISDSIQQQRSLDSGWKTDAAKVNSSTQASKQVKKLPLAPPAALLPATLIRTFDTSKQAWNPSSPDPSGVDYWPPTGGLIIVDSEVDEMSNYFTGKNVFLSNLSGTLIGTCTTTPLNRSGWSNEPTGVAVNPYNNHIFISDDNLFKIFEVNLGGDGTYCTADDTVTSVNTTVDTEDVAYGNNTLFIAGGTDARVVKFSLGPNGVLGGGDDGPVTQFDTAALGFSNLEGIGYNADKGTLFVISTAGIDKYLGEVTTNGTLLRAYDLSLMGAGSNIRSDVAWAPSSQNPAVKSIYIVSRGIDNDSNSSENDGKAWEISLGAAPTAAISVYVGASGTPVGTYSVGIAQSTRQNYDNLDDGPVKVISTNHVPIVSALRDLWWNGNAYTSSTQLMGLPQNLLSDTYVFPSYNNVNLNDQLRFGNVGNANTVVTVTIGGVVRGNYPLAPNQRQKVNYAGLDSGPVVVKSSNGVKIIASIRDAWINNGVTSSYSQLMGLPQSQLSDTYLFPSYNNVSLSDQLRFGNVGNAPTTVTVTIGGVVRGSYYLLPNQRDKATYPGLDSGPVIVKSSNGVKIIASLREAWLNNGVTTSYFQMMGLPQSQLSDKYVFPAYDNVSLSGQLRFGNVGNANTTVTVTIGGQLMGSYPLAPNQRQKVGYNVDDGPMVVQSSNGVPIIAALRDAWLMNGVTTSFSQLMGLPGGQISTTYVFPSYNNVTYDNQLRIGVP